MFQRVLVPLTGSGRTRAKMSELMVVLVGQRMIPVQWVAVDKAGWMMNWREVGKVMTVVGKLATELGCQIRVIGKRMIELGYGISGVGKGVSWVD